MSLGFASFESGVPSPKDQVCLSGGEPPSTSALNWPVRGAGPSSGSASAHASSGAGSSSVLPVAAVVVVVTAPAATVVVVARGASLGFSPPHPGKRARRGRGGGVAGQGGARFMHGPPWWGFSK